MPKSFFRYNLKADYRFFCLFLGSEKQVSSQKSYFLPIFALLIPTQKNTMKKTLATLALLLSFFASNAQNLDSAYAKLHHFAQNFKDFEKHTSKIALDTLVLDKNTLHIYFSGNLVYTPFRAETVIDFYKKIRLGLGKDFDKYKIQAYGMNYPIEQLVPNFYRNPKDYDKNRLPKKTIQAKPIVERLNRPFEISKGLKNRHLALWHSHGWYYEPKLDRWEWQRSRNFQTVEDLLPMSFVLPYLVPMLENAGANVFLPRERDTQKNEVIVDNSSANYEEKGTWQDGGKGFGIGNPPYKKGLNPFENGNFRKADFDKKNPVLAIYSPQIPEKGNYAVYVSYQSLDNSTENALYTVSHAGGKTEFLVNQKIGGGTWIYLGSFAFEKGKTQISVQHKGKKKEVLSTDAVRLGGGMGVIERNGKTSQRPKYQEAALYFLQFSGISDSLVLNLNNGNDYKDDYQSRGEWVNYLVGKPFGPKRNRNAKGLGIPIELSLAFHTDAGIRKDKTVGTLMIYDSQNDLGVFPDGQSRLANRDLADLMQTQIVEDIRKKYDSTWTRRAIWDKDYSEAARPTVPSALLELLSHQNFEDMRFAHNPNYRFDVSRAIYKSMLRFLAAQYQIPYIVQPLAPKNFSAEIVQNKVRLRWKAQIDSLEATATPTGFVVYTRQEDKGFDNGIFSKNNEIELPIEKGKLYSFKVSAINEGGESFASEILAVYQHDTEQKPVLIVNGFDRIGGLAEVNLSDFQGFMDSEDMGVADGYALNYIGSQYDFSPNSKWKDDDADGHGASHADFENVILKGNTFDFVFEHGQILKELGKSFVACSNESIENGSINLENYKTVDWILGEQKTITFKNRSQFKTFSPKMQEKIKSFCEKGGNLLVSGAYIGTDLFEYGTESDKIFAKETLKFFWRTNHATKSNGDFYAVSPDFEGLKGEINMHYNPDIYICESPDAIEPTDPLAQTFLRYNENNKSAGICYKKDYKVVVLGFPIESLKSGRLEILKKTMDFFEK